MPINKKGQAIVIDLFLSLVIFVIAITFIVTTYGINAWRLEYETSYNSLLLKAFDITEMLTKSEGIPGDWNTTSVQAIGLASNDRVLSTNKLKLLSNMSYNQIKNLFGIVSKEFLLQIRDLSNANLFEAGVSPLENNPCGKDYESVTLKRFAVWEGQKVILYFTLWDDNCNRNASVSRLIIGNIQQYTSAPAKAFEEDSNPQWTTEVKTLNDYIYATAIDEVLIKPDYMQLDFPNLGITSTRSILNATFKVWHKEYLAGDTFPPSESNRHEIQCWNGNWISLGTYPVNVNNYTFVEYSVDISNCIKTVELANNINLRMTFDPSSNYGGTLDVDYAEVIVNAG